MGQTPTRRSRGDEVFEGGLQIGKSGTKLKKVVYGTVTVDPASLAAGAIANTAVTITGVKVGDIVRLTPPSTLEAGLVPIGSPVTGNDTVSLRLYNPTGGVVDGASKTWEYVWFQMA